MDKLYQCPYAEATRCSLTEPCLGCETFCEYRHGVCKHEDIVTEENGNTFPYGDKTEIDRCRECGKVIKYKVLS